MTDGRTDRSGAASDLRRRSIISAAVTVFTQRGYAGSSTREIATECGLKQGHLYYYYPAKEEILYAIVTELHDSFLEGMDRWIENADDEPVNKMRAVLNGHVTLLCEKYHETFVSYENYRFLEAGHRTIIVEKRQEYERRLNAMIDECGPRVLAIPGGVVTKAVLGVVNWPYQWYSPKGSTSVNSLAQWLSDLGISTLGLANEERAHPQTE